MNSNLDPSGSHLSKAEKDLENVLRPDAFSSATVLAISSGEYEVRALYAAS